MELSLFGRRFSQDAGILQLMDDLGKALESPGGKIMLGGGNPAAIPEMTRQWRRRFSEILTADGELESMVAQYDAPGGREGFKKSMAASLKRNFGWDIGPENIAVTGGSQAAFFLLFNLLAGDFGGGQRRSILFPLAPEYIGYADQALHPGQFFSHKPRVVEEEAPFFKYYVDFRDLQVGPDIGALCAGRPTNPTGNVLTSEEVTQLARLAREAGRPLILDNAYGAPFPSILFDAVEPYWDPNTVLSFSLSKLGLPSVRTGIVVASEPLVRAMTGANAVLNLTNPGIGQTLVQPMIDDDSLLALSRTVIGPFYEKARDFALAVARAAMDGRVNWRVHRPQGSIFLWFWFPDLTTGSTELYRRLKEKGVLVVPGDAFFFGLPPSEDQWPHRHQCVRVNYARPEAEIEAGLRILADTVAEASR